MKKITTLLTAIIGMAFMNQVSATHVTVEVPTAGQLSSLVQNANCDSITISGNLDGNDFWFIREQMPNLIYLNIGKVTVPDNKLPESGLYSKKALQKIILPDNLGTIGNHAFAYCSNLKDITFPKSLVTIEYNAFYQSGLTEATLPDKLKNIGDAAFYECYNLKKVNFPEKLVSIGNSAFRQCNLSEIAFPDSLKAIGSNAFRYCQQLQKVTFPEKLETIGTHAFNDCISLKEIELPTTLTDIKNGAFQNCWSLASIQIPDNVTTISQSSFYHCTSLIQVKFPTKLKSISNSAFQECSALTKINLPEGVLTISSNAFYQCSALEEISFPSTLTTLGSTAFYHCSNLTEITLPASLTYCYHPFYECHNIKKVTCLASVPPTLENDYDILYGVDKSSTELLVPFWSVNSYKLASGWDAFPTINPLDYETDLINVPGELVIAADIRFKNNPTVSVFDNGRLTVRGTDALSMKKYTQSHTLSGYDDNNWSYRNPVYTNLLSESGAMRADSVIYKLNLKREYWQFITLPFDVNRADMQVNNDALFVIRYYDGKARADGETGNWKDVPANGTLQAGTGYIIQANKQTQLTLKAINNDNKNRLFSGNSLKRTLDEYASEFAHNASWNFIGNPYPCFYDIYYMDYTSPITIWDTRNRTYTAVSTEDDNYILSPMQAFFIQKPVEMKEISFSAEGRQLDATVRQRTTTRSAISSDRTVFNFALNDGIYTDRTRIVINPEASMDYEMSRDAAKFMSDDKDVPQLFTLDATGKYYAINERPLGNGIVSVGIYTGKSGTYTLSLVDATVTADEVILTDKQTGSETRLDLDSYTFTAEAGFCTNRFELHLTTRTITGVEEVQNTNVAQVTAGTGQILISAQPGDVMRICNVTGQVIERRILTESSISLPVAPGFYIVTIGKETFKIMVTK